MRSGIADARDNKHFVNAPEKHLRFRCQISRDLRSFLMYISREPNTGAPDLAEILAALAIDAAVFEDTRSPTGDREEHFRLWCADRDFDPDSRERERQFRQVSNQSARLRNTLGATQYYELLGMAEKLLGESFAERERRTR